MPLIGSVLTACAALSCRADRTNDALQRQPLLERNAQSNGMRFTALRPEETGIVAENRYADPSMWGERNMEYAVGELGTGVAAADYDNDGRPDVFLVSKTGVNRLFRNLGGWRFEDVTVRSGIGRAAPDDVRVWKQGASFADVNNDGWIDLYVCRMGAPNQLFINQGDGTFVEEAARRGLAVDDASCIGAFSDFDRDGWLDVYVQTNLLDARRQPLGRPDYLFRNNGDGTFTDVTARARIGGETQGHSATWWDYNADGWPDLYVANDFARPDSLYKNNGDGTFTDVIHSVVPVMPYSSMGSDVGDINNDGRIDFFVADMAPTTREKDMRGMAVARELSQEDAPGNAAQQLRNTLFINTGTGRMLEVAHLAGVEATDWTWSVRFEDLDNDGLLDLHVTNGMDREYQNADLRERVLTSESEEQRVRVMKESPLLRERNLAYRNRGDGRFEEVAAAWGLDQEGVSFGTAFADFDGDGDLDLIHANYDAAPTVLRNDSPGGHRLLVRLKGQRSNRFGIGAVVRIQTSSGTQVRPLVVARGSLSSSDPAAHFGLGTDRVVDRLTVEWTSGYHQVFEQVEADAVVTITEPDGEPPGPVSTGGAVPAWFSEDARAFGQDFTIEESFETDPQPLLPRRFDREGPGLATGDLNADGHPDLVLGGTSREGTRVLLGSAKGFKAGGSLPAARVDDGPLVVFDANGDGRPDLLRTRGGTTRPAVSAEYQPALYSGVGDGSFVPAPEALPPLKISAGAAAAADFDRDGKVDLFLGGRVLPRRYPQAPPSVLLKNDGGAFREVTADFAPGIAGIGMVTAAVWVDLNADSWPDLVLALDWGGVRCFLNREGRQLEEATASLGFDSARAGWWSCVSPGDFNGDGRPDLALGNVGLNTPYTAPVRVLAGNFAAGNVLQVIEIVGEDGRDYPRRTLTALAPHLPGLRKRYPRNDDYARAPVEEVLGREAIARAGAWVAEELSSGVLLSTSGGGYRFEPLPLPAQVAPVRKIAVSDFDQDGALDLALVHNSTAPIPQAGRMQGGLGLILRGDGRGGFSPVEPAVTGFVVPGEASDVVVLDVDQDGHDDLVVSRNHRSMLVFRRTAAPISGADER